MSESRPFNPCGPTIKVAADSTAPAGVQASLSGARDKRQFRVHNAGAKTAWYAFGTSGADAQAKAVIPTGGGAGAKDSYPLPAGAIEVISAPEGSFWSGITATAGSADLYITPGEGV